MASQGAHMVPKSSLLGAKRVTLSGKVAESAPLQKHKFLRCFSYIFEVPAPLLAIKIVPGTLLLCGAVFFPNFLAFQGALGALRCRKVNPRVPPSLPRDVPKSTQNPPEFQPKSVQNPLKILPKSTQNHTKFMMEVKSEPNSENV